MAYQSNQKPGERLLELLSVPLYAFEFGVLGLLALSHEIARRMRKRP